MAKLFHPELSYQVRGALLHVYNTLGPMLREAYYEEAIAIALDKRQIRCQTQKEFQVYYAGKRVGLYYVDVWVEDGKILLELKVAPAIEPIHKAQAISYLKVSDSDLAIVVNYGGPSLEDERFPNFVRDKHSEFVWQSRPVSEELLYPDLTDAIERACHCVHFTLGPGFLHQVYRRATMIELEQCGLNYEYIKHLPVEYEGHHLGQEEARLVAVDGKVLLAAFALRQTNSIMSERLKANMRRLGIKLGLLANFYDTRMVMTPVRIK